jgi:hypothetical protein
MGYHLLLVFVLILANSNGVLVSMCKDLIAVLCQHKHQRSELVDLSTRGFVSKMLCTNLKVVGGRTDLIFGVSQFFENTAKFALLHTGFLSGD